MKHVAWMGAIAAWAVSGVAQAQARYVPDEEGEPLGAEGLICVGVMIALVWAMYSKNAPFRDWESNNPVLAKVLVLGIPAVLYALLK